MRDAGASKILFGSCAPIIKFQNIYGIDIPTINELLSYNRNLKEMKKFLNVDFLIFQNYIDLKKSITDFNKNILEFEDCVFTGNYIKNINFNIHKYLKNLEIEKK